MSEAYAISPAGAFRSGPDDPDPVTGDASYDDAGYDDGYDDRPEPHTVAAPWAVVAFAVALFLPLQMTVGSLTLSSVRVVLLALLLGLLGRFLRTRRTAVDLLVVGHVVWVWLSFAMTEGVATATEAGTIYAVETLGGYLIGRVAVRSAAGAGGAIRLLSLLFLLTLPLAVLEFGTGRRLVSGLLGGPAVATDVRMGFFRTHGPFQHPIHFGCTAAALLGALVYAARDPRLRLAGRNLRRALTGSVVASTVMGLTSGGLLTLVVQAVLIGWDRLVRRPQKWWWFAGVAGVGYVALDLLSNQSGYVAVLSRLTFNAETLHYRRYIFQYGMENVWALPWLGRGFADWARPEWMVSATVDNFWLLTAMRHGVPAFLTLLLATLLMLRGRVADPENTTLLTGARVSVAGLALAAFTVHLWGVPLVFFMFLLGLAEAVRNLPAELPEDDADEAFAADPDGYEGLAAPRAGVSTSTEARA